MQFLILGLLLDGPLSLYDVRKRFAAGISLFYAASFGSIQRALGQVESKGWVTRVDADDSRRRKKLYVIEDSGRRAWREWMLSPITGSDPEPTMLAKVYLLGSLPAADRGDCLRMLRERIAADADRLVSLAAELDETEIPDDVREVYGYRRATLDHGIRAQALTARWLDELETS
ncbi:helix-turn-helix transcriptional regulator [Aeromicrobium sp. YIM 150415]|uniref:helix-turn-helix transcriptional regulator n=1 Tax=Aeromicrobium sp. YIM 150415 TaxID=2803912 RepID=UPI0019658213|nr:helix-turn-helix transcriptional regulator [Aeromicrobium sp. YIM 150415]MBM9464993.1 helix-turn-helix transcriptional regulator [Aeromicrobium sp. YIM 150415]